jgi:hypothetical protein
MNGDEAKCILNLGTEVKRYLWGLPTLASGNDPPPPSAIICIGGSVDSSVWMRDVCPVASQYNDNCLQPCAIPHECKITFICSIPSYIIQQSAECHNDVWVSHVLFPGNWAFSMSHLCSSAITAPVSRNNALFHVPSLWFTLCNTVLESVSRSTLPVSEYFSTLFLSWHLFIAFNNLTNSSVARFLLNTV